MRVICEIGRETVCHWQTLLALTDCDPTAVLGGRQERPVAHPAGEAFMNPAMAERGRMGAHPGEVTIVISQQS